MCRPRTALQVMQGPQQRAKAIVFSHFWMHLQLIAAHLRDAGIEHAVLKRDMTPPDKADALDTFQVHACTLGAGA